MFRLNQFRQIQTKCRLQHDVERILSSYLSKLDQFNALVDIMIVADNSKQTNAVLLFNQRSIMWVKKPNSSSSTFWIDIYES